MRCVVLAMAYYCFRHFMQYYDYYFTPFSLQIIVVLFSCFRFITLAFVLLHITYVQTAVQSDVRCPLIVNIDA